MQTISLEEAQMHLLKIIDNLAPGEEIIIIHNDEPLATIRAAQNSKHIEPRLGTLKGSIMFIASDFDAIPEGFEDYLLP
jgi:antitoxin (DNA-binding transcriptional repressor) of toxin-antitoxin stability system